MDAKQRVRFINAQGGQNTGSVGASRICPKCHAEVKGKFCTKCGTKYEEPVKVEEPVNKNPFASVAEDIIKEEKKPSSVPEIRKSPIFQAIQEPEPTVPEEESALAKGLPEWNIEPPQVVVRRKRR
ncbi:MAG: zinc ribbon domain-containing protein [Eubacteriales bacterium]|nr:zinc ribbon domain-containing protein [Eubacteriales bacterium]